MQAVNIMELALKRYGSYEMFEQVTGGNLLPRSRIWINVKRYMEKEGCVGEVGGEQAAHFSHADSSLDPNWLNSLREGCLVLDFSLASLGLQSLCFV